MRVLLRCDDAEAVACKFDGGFEDLLDSCETKLGWRPHALWVGGVLLSDVTNLAENDTLHCERNPTSASHKRAAEEGADPLIGVASSQITVMVKAQDGSDGDIYFKVKPSTKVQKILKAFEEQKRVVSGTYRFTFEGQRLPDIRLPSDDTIAYWEMEDGDQIDAFYQAEGGGCR